MAKKKTETPSVKKAESKKPEPKKVETPKVEDPKEEVIVDETEENAEKVDETPVVAENPKGHPEPKKVETPKVEAVEKDIPSDALIVLKAFNDMEYLYIGKGGGIFRNGTPESVRGKAVLYKNPYFKNNKTEN